MTLRTTLIILMDGKEFRMQQSKDIHYRLPPIGFIVSPDDGYKFVVLVLCSMVTCEIKRGVIVMSESHDRS